MFKTISNIKLIIFYILLFLSVAVVAREVIIVGDMFYEAKTKYKECENLQCCQAWYLTLDTIYIVFDPIVTRVETTSSNPAWHDYPIKITCWIKEVIQDGWKSSRPY
jgi:hypothetical protein